VGVKQVGPLCSALERVLGALQWMKMENVSGFYKKNIKKKIRRDMMSEEWNVIFAIIWQKIVSKVLLLSLVHPALLSL
jgi:hypothetical protein